MQPLHTLCRRIGNFVLLFGAMPDLHYINGPDTLPPPLTPQEEQQALCGLAAGEGAARDALITHNLRLVVYIAKKFESSTAGVEDMISIGTIGLIKAVNTFEPGKNIKLATYASRCIENAPDKFTVVYTVKRRVHPIFFRSLANGYNVLMSQKSNRVKGTVTSLPKIKQTCF